MRDQWEADKAVAGGILADRRSRRKALGGFASVMLGMFALGLWGIDGWLKESPLRFGLYWAVCGLLCLFVMAFALLDALAVIKEERER
jgi:hypothetical protein